MISLSVAAPVEKQGLVIVLFYLDDLPLKLITQAQNCFHKKIPINKVNVIFKSSTCLVKFFRVKQLITVGSHLKVVCKFWCSVYSATNYGETNRYLKLRADEHSDVLPLTK